MQAAALTVADTRSARFPLLQRCPDHHSRQFFVRFHPERGQVAFAEHQREQEEIFDPVCDLPFMIVE